MHPDEIDLNKLRTFFHVAEAGSVSGAARRLALTRSAVSQSLSALEESLGTALFHRVGRGLVATPAGERLQRRFRELEGLLAQSLDEIAGEQRTVRGEVRVGLFVGFPTTRLAPLLARFSAAHPQARVRVRYGTERELWTELVAARLDFVFSLDRPRPSLRGLRAERLFEQELVMVAGRRLHPGRLSLEALRELPVVDYYRGDPLVLRWARHHFRTRPRELKVVVWAANTDLALELILRQVGIGVLPRDVAQPFVRRGRLRVVATGKRELTDTIWLNELDTPHRGAALDAFHDTAVATFSERAG